MQAHAFPPFSVIRQVINKVIPSHNLDLNLVAPLWHQKEWLPDLLELLVEPPLQLPEGKGESTERPSQTATPPPLPPKFPSAKPLCLETVQLYARHEGFSNSMAKQLSLTRRKPTRVIYQNRVHGIRTRNGAERKVTQSLAHLSLNIRILLICA